MRRRTATSTSSSDDDLMRAAGCGEEAAFSELIRRHRGWVCALLRTIVRDRETAEDLAQETFCRLHRHRGGYAARGQFVPWLKRIAVNIARDFLRRQGEAVFVGLEALEGTPSPDDDPRRPEAALLARGLRDELRAAIAALPDDQRRAVVLRYFGDHSVRDIARVMSCPEGTVKSRLFHGLRRVRDRLTVAAPAPTNDERDSEPS
jgi:RNA polymerase sigma-70 factor (ECF subfamily)